MFTPRSVACSVLQLKRSGFAEMFIKGSDRLQIGAVDAAHIVFPLAATAATNAYAAASHIVRDGPLE
jgi:hypothetical protein